MTSPHYYFARFPGQLQLQLLLLTVGLLEHGVTRGGSLDLRQSGGSLRVFSEEPATILDFVSNSELFTTCEDILKQSDGRPGAVQAVCLDRAKKALDKKYKDKRRPPGMAMRLLEECEELEKRAEADRAASGSIPAPAVCGKLIKEDAEKTGTDLAEYVPKERLKGACAGAFEGEAVGEAKCLESYETVLEEEVGLSKTSLPPAYCAQLKTAAKDPVTDKGAFCAELATAGPPTPVAEPAPAPAPAAIKESQPPVNADGDKNTVSVEGGGVTVPAKLESHPPPFVPTIGDAPFGTGKGTGAGFAVAHAAAPKPKAPPAALEEEAVAEGATDLGKVADKKGAGAAGAEKTGTETGGAAGKAGVEEKKKVGSAETTSTSVDEKAAGGKKELTATETQKKSQATLDSLNKDMRAKNQGDAPPAVDQQGDPKGVPSTLPRKMSTQDVKNNLP